MYNPVTQPDLLQFQNRYRQCFSTKMSSAPTRLCAEGTMSVLYGLPIFYILFAVSTVWYWILCPCLHPSEQSWLPVVVIMLHSDGHCFSLFFDLSIRWRLTQNLEVSDRIEDSYALQLQWCRERRCCWPRIVCSWKYLANEICGLMTTYFDCTKLVVLEMVAFEKRSHPRTIPLDSTVDEVRRLTGQRFGQGQERPRDLPRSTPAISVIWNTVWKWFCIWRTPPASVVVVMMFFLFSRSLIGQVRTDRAANHPSRRTVRGGKLSGGGDTRACSSYERVASEFAEMNGMLYVGAFCC